MPDGLGNIFDQVRVRSDGGYVVGNRGGRMDESGGRFLDDVDRCAGMMTEEEGGRLRDHRNNSDPCEAFL